MVDACLRLYKARYPADEISVCLPTPGHTPLGGDWSDQVDFPKVPTGQGWPAEPDEETRLPWSRPPRE